MAQCVSPHPVPRVILTVTLVFLGMLSVIVVIGLHPMPPKIASAQISPSTPAPLPTPSPQPGISTEAMKAVVYISEREGIPAAALVVEEEFRRTSALLGRTFQAVTLLDQRSGRIFKVLVDVDNGHVQDRATVEVAEEEAFGAHYGKLQPALYDRLQTLGNEDCVTVTIWAATAPGESLPEVQAAASSILAARYPQAAEAMARGSKPMDVADRDLAERIYREYLEIVNGRIALRIQSLVQAIEGQGFVVRTAPGFPAVTTSLPKRVILEIANRDDVGTIWLTGSEEWQLFLDVAIPTDRVPAVWQRGLTVPV